MNIFQRIKSEIAYLRGSLRALRRTGKVARNPGRTFRDVAEELVEQYGDRMALLSDNGNLTYREWNAHANQYGRWFQARGLGKGDVVAVMMPNRPDYVSLWFGLTKAGGVAALLNTNLLSQSLAHCINIVKAHVVIVDASLMQTFETARPYLDANIEVVVFGNGPEGMTRVDQERLAYADHNLQGDERPALTINDPSLYIYTSGTTGLPKAAIINHYRLQMATIGFAAVNDTNDQDRMYVCLPMYHTTGGLCAIGSALVAGGSCFIREKFSARQFWADIVQHECTMFVYVGELCRYLVVAPPGPMERQHKIRSCFGNGMRPDVWPSFKERFGIPRIVEFYAATEGNVTLFNFDSWPGSVGRIPKWAEKRFIVRIVTLDVETEQPVRGPDGLCIVCQPGEVGEVLGEILVDPNRPTNRFDGYADKAATEKKILRDVLRKGDAWFRSGDLMRKDELGYFYFVDRIGDTFRWKGENVSTNEVSQMMTGFEGIKDATVYGVEVPGHEGRAGMAALVVDDPATFDMAGFRAFLAAHLPEYARPLFLRFQDHLDITATFKQRKGDLVKEGFDPAKISEKLFFSDAASAAFVPIDPALYAKLAAGSMRL